MPRTPDRGRPHHDRRAQRLVLAQIDHILLTFQGEPLQAGNLKENTERSRVKYTHDVAAFLAYLEAVDIHDFRDVTPNHIRNYLARLDRQDLAGVTRRKKLTIIRTFFGWLKSTGVMRTNPAKQVTPPQTEDREPRVLSKGEYQRLLSVDQKPRDRAIIQVLLQTGIRLSEIQRVTLHDLNLPGRITREGLGTLRILGKGRKTRTVLLNSKACEALQNWLDQRPDVATAHLFISNRHRPISSRQFQYIVGKYLKLAGISNAGVHTLDA